MSQKFRKDRLKEPGLTPPVGEPPLAVDAPSETPASTSPPPEATPAPAVSVPVEPTVPSLTPTLASTLAPSSSPTPMPVDLDDLDSVSADLSWALEVPQSAEELSDHPVSTPYGEPIVDPPVFPPDVDAPEPLRDLDASLPEPEPEPEYEIPVSKAPSSARKMVAGTLGRKSEPESFTMPVAGNRTTLRRRVPEDSEGEIAQLWSHVFFAADHAPPRGVVVTSARRGDGSSQIATSLAILGASSNRELRIALVDFNVRGPKVAELLGIAPSPGLTDVLEGRVTLEAALQAVELPGGGEFHVLTGGSRADQPLGLLKSRQIQATISRLRDRYDHVIFDTPAANAFPDAKMVGSMVDGAILVARAGHTPRETIAEAKRRLETGGVKVLGLVLNQRTDPIPDALYQMI